MTMQRQITGSLVSSAFVSNVTHPIVIARVGVQVEKTKQYSGEHHADREPMKPASFQKDT